jgi:hypothetical protein
MGRETEMGRNIGIGRVIVMEIWRQIEMVMMIRIGMEMETRGGEGGKKEGD